MSIGFFRDFCCWFLCMFLLRNRRVPPLWLDLRFADWSCSMASWAWQCCSVTRDLGLLAFDKALVDRCVVEFCAADLRADLLGQFRIHLNRISVVLVCWRMLQIWWPNSGLWIVASVVALLVIVWRHRSGISSPGSAAFCCWLCCCPNRRLYAVAFAVLVDLSRSCDVMPGV